MGRKRINAVHAFFAHDNTSNTSRCIISGCKAVLKGVHATNLIHHLAAHHFDEYKVVQKRNVINRSIQVIKVNKSNVSVQNRSSLNESKKSEEMNVDEDSSHATSEVTPFSLDYLRTQCVNLVTVHGRPLSLMDDLAFQNILAMTGISPWECQQLHSQSIKTAVEEENERTREVIMKDIKDKLISLKIDSVTREDRTAIAVYVQYIENGSMVLKILGVTEMPEISLEQQREILFNIIRRYEISVEQIYTIVSDNGANYILKQSSSLNDPLQEHNDDISDEDLDPDCGERALEVKIQSESEESYSITSVRCVAHSLHLAIQDALKESEIASTIEQARTILRRLRTSTKNNLIKSEYGDQPVPNYSNRWHLTLEMLKRLQSLRECCSESPIDSLYLPKTTWDAIDEMITALTPAKSFTIVLQRELLTLGDFFYHWTKCHLETSHISSPLAQQICISMKNRKDQLMTDPTFLSALYLDPRFQVVLSISQEAVAIQHLCTTWLRMSRFDSARVNINLDEETQNRPTSTTASETDDEMEGILFEIEADKKVQRARYYQTPADILNVIQRFSNHPRMKSKGDILSFWESKALAQPLLYSLAKTVLAVPASQVSLGRLFAS